MAYPVSDQLNVNIIHFSVILYSFSTTIRAFSIRGVKHPSLDSVASAHIIVLCSRVYLGGTLQNYLNIFNIQTF